MTGQLDKDAGYLALSRHLYWATEAGSRSEVGTKQVREQLLEFVARMRTDERLLIPLGEPHLSSPTPWKRKLKYALFRYTRFATRRYDRLIADEADLSVSLAERVIELEQDLAALRDRLERAEHDAERGSDGP
jgi:hypothetical protein